MTQCPACGTGNLAGANFCQACGHRFLGPDAPMPPPEKARSPGILIWLGAAAVLVIGGVLFFVMALGSPRSAPASVNSSTHFQTDPKIAATSERLHKVVGALDLWLKKHMSYPELAEFLVRDDYLRPTDFDDAWGRRVDYTRLEAMRYRLCSRGADNLPKTEDDVCLGGRP